MTNKLKTDWSFNLPENGTHEQHLAIKNTLEALGYEWCGNSIGDVGLDWGFYTTIILEPHIPYFSGSSELCTNHFSSFLDFLVWHFQEETKEQKEIKDIRSQMEKLTKRLKQLEG